VSETRAPYATSTSTVCPVIVNAEAALKAAHHLKSAVRRLKFTLHLCHSCPVASECGAISEINRQIELAITEVTQEWGLNA